MNGGYSYDPLNIPDLIYLTECPACPRAMRFFCGTTVDLIDHALEHSRRDI